MNGIYFDANPAVVTNTTYNTFHVDADNIVENEQEKFNVIVYPNPAKSEATVYFNQALSEEYVLRIYNLLGEVEYSRDNLSSNQLTVDLNNFSQGLYRLTVENKVTRQREYSAKLIKN
jgi:hypothetical protein